MPESSSSRPTLIGHRGAPALAPENTLAGFEAALAAGVDAVEFDVRRDRGGRLVVAHSRRRARGGQSVALEEAVAFFADASRVGVGLVVDVKQRGIETELIDQLEAADLTQRTVACAREVDVLKRLGESGQSLRRAWSLKRARHTVPARLRTPRGDVAAAASAAIRTDLTELVTVHRSLATQELIDAVHDVGGQVYVWDVAPTSAPALAELGVDALIVDDPGAVSALLGGRE